ncbi:hypothetical protein QJS66_18145 [Kocuria rhizophila]|nr:hypothetical protein QJS66_18145 [Kocuria rhizophila]
MILRSRPAWAPWHPWRSCGRLGHHERAHGHPQPDRTGAAVRLVVRETKLILDHDRRSTPPRSRSTSSWAPTPGRRTRSCTTRWTSAPPYLVLSETGSAPGPRGHHGPLSRGVALPPAGSSRTPPPGRRRGFPCRQAHRGTHDVAGL